MKKRELAEILTEHADALNEGTDITPELAERYPVQEKEILSLFKTAGLIKEALQPVSASAFEAQLRHRLDTYAPSEVIIRPPAAGIRMLWLAVAAAGSFLSVVGLVVVVLRRLRTAGGGAPGPQQRLLNHL